MVQINELKNKESGEVLKTKEGKVLKEYKLEEGDEFIPRINSLLEKKSKDKEGKTIINYSLPVKVRNEKGELFQNEEGEEEIFVTLTPTQAKNFRNTTEKKGIFPNQNLWTTYSYYSEKYQSNFLGITLKSENTKALDFEDLEKEEE